MGYDLLLPQRYLVAEAQAVVSGCERRLRKYRGPAGADSEPLSGVSPIGLHARSEVHGPIVRLRAPARESSDCGLYHPAILVDVAARDESGGRKPADPDELRQPRNGGPVVKQICSKSYVQGFLG